MKELLDGEPAYTYNYWDDPLWEVTKGGIGDKGLEYKPKTLEVGKWYKYQGFDHKGNDIKIMFLFNGVKGNEGKTIGFDNNGEYCDNMSIYYASVETFQEASHQEVIEAFIYHMETFANKRKSKKTNNQQSQEEDYWIKPEGVRMLVWNDYEEKAIEKIVIAKLPENTIYPYACVQPSYEEEFKKGEKYLIIHHKNAKPIPQIKEITMQEIADKFNLKVNEFKIV